MGVDHTNQKRRLNLNLIMTRIELRLGVPYYTSMNTIITVLRLARATLAEPGISTVTPPAALRGSNYAIEIIEILLVRI